VSQPNRPAPIHAPTLIAAADHDGPLWSNASEQLNANLLRFSAGQGIAAHVNSELDVLVVVLGGLGRITIEEDQYDMTAGAIIVIPRGTRRSIVSLSDSLAYVTCHRRRAGLLPEGV
jgi:quercetin dioxygenase-like cupin family protein